MVHPLAIDVLRQAGVEFALFLAKLHPRNVAQPHQSAVHLAHHQIFKIAHRLQVGIRQHADALPVVFTAPQSGNDIVGGQRIAQIVGADIKGKHLGRIDPQPHGRAAAALDADPLHPVNGRQNRVDVARQIIGHRSAREPLGRHTQVEQREQAVGAAHLHCGVFRPGGQLKANLIQAAGQFRQCRRAVLIQF